MTSFSKYYKENVTESTDSGFHTWLTPGEEEFIEEVSKEVQVILNNYNQQIIETFKALKWATHISFRTTDSSFKLVAEYIRDKVERVFEKNIQKFLNKTLSNITDPKFKPHVQHSFKWWNQTFYVCTFRRFFLDSYLLFDRDNEDVQLRILDTLDPGYHPLHGSEAVSPKYLPSFDLIYTEKKIKEALKNIFKKLFELPSPHSDSYHSTIYSLYMQARQIDIAPAIVKQSYKETGLQDFIDF